MSRLEGAHSLRFQLKGQQFRSFRSGVRHLAVASVAAAAGVGAAAVGVVGSVGSALFAAVRSVTAHADCSGCIFTLSWSPFLRLSTSESGTAEGVEVAAVPRRPQVNGLMSFKLIHCPQLNGCHFPLSQSEQSESRRSPHLLTTLLKGAENSYICLPVYTHVGVGVSVANTNLPLLLLL